MVDIVDKATRSRMMAGIRGANTHPEITLRKALHARGFRFRLHDRRLPGRPDIVLSKFRAVVFVHGCFWHRHPGCRFSSNPATRKSFWDEKFSGNVARDKRNLIALRAEGWRTAVIWECVLRVKDPSPAIEKLSAWICSNDMDLELPDMAIF